MLHLHFAVEFTSFPAPGMDRPPGRKAITSSPPHSRHCRIAIVMLLPQAGVIHLVTIEQCSGLGTRANSKTLAHRGKWPMSGNTSMKEYFEVSRLTQHLDGAENGIRRSAHGCKPSRVDCSRSQHLHKRRASWPLRWLTRLSIISAVSPNSLRPESQVKTLL